MPSTNSRSVAEDTKIRYADSMYNWSVDENKLKKTSKKHMIWKLEQQINFGLNQEKLQESEIRKYWSDLHLDPHRKRFLQLLLDGKLDSH